MPVKTCAVPHDLLKPVLWSKHESPEEIEKWYNLQFIDLLKSFQYKSWGYNDVEEERTLLDAIEGHGKKDRFWERCLSMSDRLAAAIGRLKYRWIFWDIRFEEDLKNMFLLKVYDFEDNVKRPILIGKEMLEKIINILSVERDSGIVFEKLNDLLNDYPSDSRFPLVSLKSHHWLSDAIRRCRGLRECCRYKRVPESIYFIRFSVYPISFHRLRDLRAFRNFAVEAIRSICSRSDLSWRLPLIVGDEAYLVTVDKNEVKEILDIVEGTRLPLRIEVYTWIVKNHRIKERDNFLIQSVSRDLYYVGEPEPPEFSPREAQRWAGELEENERVLWLRVGLAGSLEDAARQFLDKAEEKLTKLPHEDLPDEERLEQNIDLSPDIMVSLADGLDQFYDKCAEIISGGESREDVTVIKSLEESIYLKGLDDLSGILNLVNELINLTRKVLVDISISGVICDGKYPFWRVYELLKSQQNLFMIKGERVLKITTQDVPHIRRITQMIEKGGLEISKSQFMEIVKEVRRVDGPEPLKLLIDAKFKEGKLFKRGSTQAQNFINNIKNMIDTLYRNHGNMDAVVEALEIISSYIGPEKRYEREAWEEEWLE